jgi:choline dehydrogenase
MDAPVINPNWLGTATDQKVAVAAYKRAREAFRTQAMNSVIMGQEYFPGVGCQTDEEILDIIKNTMMTIYHASCTCKMGVQNDSMAVVDSRARVFGVTGLRVVDASAFPILPPGHPQSVVCEFFSYSPSVRLLLIILKTCWQKRLRPILLLTG